MTEPGVDRPPSEFKAAWRALAVAEQARGSLLAGWDSLCSQRPFSIDVVTDSGGFGRVEISCQWPAALSAQMDEDALRFTRSIKAAMDEAVVATAGVVCRIMGNVDRSSHYMPLCSSREEFESLVPRGELLGLRPDQLRAVRLLQPFSDGDSAARFIGSRMQQLASMLSARPLGKRRLAIWASSAEPEVLAPQGATVTDVFAPTDGALDPTRTVATFHVEPPTNVGLRVNPNVGLDMVFNDDPWPTDPDDNIGERTNDLLILARHLIEGLEMSVSQPTLLSLVGSLDEFAPPAPREAWSPVRFSDEEQRLEALSAVESSDLKLATYRDEAGALMLLTVAGGMAVGRAIPEASVPAPGMPIGPASEDATLAAASRWGLPDFVYRPRTLLKGSGRREIGDGTIISGGLGISLQVKARENPTNDPERERRWLTKKALAAGKQAVGTRRTSLALPQVQLTNERGREIHFDGSVIDWVVVVILDHPAPPTDVHVALELRVPSLVLLRRDWDFLWDHLRSASAIVDYAHRVAGTESRELGSEAVRYFELSRADEIASPGTPQQWMTSWGATIFTGPQLPADPVAIGDEAGHAVFQNILKDIATSPFQGDEGDRLRILALIDRFAPGSRAELGRLLLKRLDQCLLTPPDETRWHHRTVLMDRGRLHLAFSVCSTLTGYHNRMHNDWLLFRRYEMLQHAEFGSADLPWSVGVLLTPRPDGDRFWDTTVVATDQPVEFDSEHLRVLEDLFSRNLLPEEPAAET